MVETSQPMIRMSEVDKSYRRGGQDLEILKRMHLEVQPADFLALMGPSGSGKSTILNLIGGLDTPDRGTVEVGGIDLATLSKNELSAWRARHVGFVFQSFNLIPVLTALENV